MSSTVSSLWYSAHLRDILLCLRKDLYLIILASIVIAAIGAGIGKYTNISSSSAQLVLTPIPLRAKATEDALAVMLAAPLDVTSMSLLCKSDQVLEETRTKLNELYEQGKLSAPIKYITKLSTKLDFSVTIAKETPYELTYTPVLQLFAKAKVPMDAEAMVNTWAEVVADAAKKFQDAVQMPAAHALEERVTELKEQLAQVEMENEKFWTENNVAYMEARMGEIISLIVNFMQTKSEVETELIAERGSLEGYTKEIANELPTVPCKWEPSPELIEVLGNRLGLPMAKDGAKEGAPADNSLLSVDHLNMVYFETRAKMVAARAGVMQREAQISEIDRRIEALEKERVELQAQYARVTTEKMRIGRLLDRVEGAYSNLATKHEFANVAGKLDHPVLQVISKGTAWPLPRFRRAIMFGGISGMFGIFAAAAISVFLRMIIRPALEA